MSKLPYQIHEHLTRKRRREISVPTPEINPVDQETKPNPLKEYPRMQRTSLPTPVEGISLHAALLKRRSTSTVVPEQLALPIFGEVMHTLALNGTGSRQYPSGGTKYPIETYVFVQRVEGLERGAYHYHPTTHSLEHLWDLPKKLEIFSAVNKWANDARAVIVFTGSWWRNQVPYGEFGYLLGMIEVGHAAQNILLGAAAANIPACPLAGFNDDPVLDILDLDPSIEQPIYCIALG